MGSVDRRSSSAPASSWPDARVARLATTGRDGRPHVVPICFAVADDLLWTAVDEKPKRSRRLRRLDNIRANPRVEVLIDHYDEDWSQLWWVRVQGTARVVHAGASRPALDALTAKYEQYRAAPPAGPVIEVAIERLRAWTANNEGQSL